MENQLNELEGQAKLLRAQLSKLRADRTALEGQLTDLELQRKALENRLTELDEDRARWEEQLDQLEGQEKQNAEAELADLEADKNTLNGRLSKLEERKRTLDDELARLEEGPLQAELSKLEKQLSKLDADKNALEEQKKALEAKQGARRIQICVSALLAICLLSGGVAWLLLRRKAEREGKRRRGGQDEDRRQASQNPRGDKNQSDPEWDALAHGGGDSRGRSDRNRGASCASDPERRAPRVDAPTDAAPFLSNAREQAAMPRRDLPGYRLGGGSLDAPVPDPRATSQASREPLAADPRATSQASRDQISVDGRLSAITQDLEGLRVQVGATSKNVQNSVEGLRVWVQSQLGEPYVAAAAKAAVDRLVSGLGDTRLVPRLDELLELGRLASFGESVAPIAIRIAKTAEIVQAVVQQAPGYSECAAKLAELARKADEQTRLGRGSSELQLSVPLSGGAKAGLTEAAGDAVVRFQDPLAYFEGSFDEIVLKELIGLAEQLAGQRTAEAEESLWQLLAASGIEDRRPRIGDQFDVQQQNLIDYGPGRRDEIVAVQTPGFAYKGDLRRKAGVIVGRG